METTKKSKLTGRALLQFVVLCAGATSIYMPVFSRGTYYNAFIEGFGINDTQFGVLFSTYTLFTLLTYFPGGVVADKFSPRKLLTFSFISTALLGFWQSTFPAYGAALFIYGAQGVTTTLTFWAALIKATRQFGQTMGGESKALGSLEGGRGLVGIVLSTVCVFTFGRFAAAAAGLRTVLWIYCSVLFLVGILAWFVFSDKKTEEAAVAAQSVPKLILECLRNPQVWVVSLMVFGAYAMTSTMGGYVTRIATSNFGLTVQFAAIIPLISTYVRPLGSFGGGILGDKLGATKTMIVGTLGLIIPAVIIIMLPKGEGLGLAIPFIVVYCIMTIFMGTVRGQFYAPLRESGVPMYLSGTAVGLIATIGYSPDLFLPIISGRLLDTMDQTAAFKIIIWVLVGFGAFSILMSSLMLSMMKKKAAKTSETAEQKAAD